MKTAAFLVMAILIAGACTGCGSDGPAGAAAVQPPTTQKTVTGLLTPQSVSVVTAN